MKKCKRCKTNAAEIGSQNCVKCNARNAKNTASFIKNIVPAKVNDNFDAFGGLGNEWETGIAGHLNNIQL